MTRWEKQNLFLLARLIHHKGNIWFFSGKNLSKKELFALVIISMIMEY